MISPDNLKISFNINGPVLNLEDIECDVEDDAIANGELTQKVNDSRMANNISRLDQSGKLSPNNT